MYPRLMFFGEQYRIVWNAQEHGEAGHAGWDSVPKEGRKYFQRSEDGMIQPANGPLDFTRPKEAPKV